MIPALLFGVVVFCYCCCTVSNKTKSLLSLLATMMKIVIHVAAVVSCFLLSSTIVTPVVGLDTHKDHELRQEFVKAMGQASGGRNRRNWKPDQQDQPAGLTKELMKVARPVVDGSTSTMNSDTASSFSSSSFQHRQMADDGDDYYQQSAVNLTDYALKYLGCQNIHTFSDDLADNQDSSSSVLEMNRFVMFRLCPRDSCSNYNEYGCNAGFGDYMITMEEYLAAMVEYFYAEYQEYCETCYYCMNTNTQYNNYNNSNGDDGGNNNRRDLGYNYYNYADNQYGDDGNAGDDAYAAADDDAANNGDDAYGAYAGDDGIQCEYYDVCERYKSACKNYNAKAELFQDYFQCSAFNLGNMVGYMGPHCQSDGHTISIGLYEDQYCNQYKSDLADMSSNSGLDFSPSYLQTYFSDNCVSCLASESYTLYADDDEEDDAVSDICYVLYEESAKCNKYMGDQGGYNSYVQQETEDSVCGFISSLIQNNYDEYGEIYLDSDAEDWMRNIPIVREMTNFQRGGLAASILLVVALLIYSCVLYRRINSSRKRFMWTPQGAGGVHMGRRSSGIIMGRSRSGPGFEPQGGGLLA